MKKSTANFICIFFDFFAIGSAYLFLCKPLNIVFTGIANRAEFIKYTTNFYMGFGPIMIPIVHMIGLIETYLPRFFNRTICTRVIYSSIMVSLLLGIGTAAMVERAILHRGYTRCEGAAIHRKLLRIEAYVLDEDICRQLTMEKESHRSAGIR